MNTDDLLTRKEQPADVPCGTCTACCKRDTVVLSDNEAHQFQHHVERGRKVLDRRADGACVYLTPAGCSVHDAPPALCRRFDCRVLFLLTPKAVRRERIAQNHTMRAVYDAGKRRLPTLR